MCAIPTESEILNARGDDWSLASHMQEARAFDKELGAGSHIENGLRNLVNAGYEIESVALTEVNDYGFCPAAGFGGWRYASMAPTALDNRGGSMGPTVTTFRCVEVLANRNGHRVEVTVSQRRGGVYGPHVVVTKRTCKAAS